MNFRWSIVHPTIDLCPRTFYINYRVPQTSTGRRLSCNRPAIMVIEGRRGVSPALTDILEITISRRWIRIPIRDPTATLTSWITTTTTLTSTPGPRWRTRRGAPAWMKKLKPHLHRDFQSRVILQQEEYSRLFRLVNC